MKFKLIDWLISKKLIESKSEVHRLCMQGAIKIEKLTIFNADTIVCIEKPFTIRIGNEFYEVI